MESIHESAERIAETYAGRYGIVSVFVEEEPYNGCLAPTVVHRVSDHEPIPDSVREHIREMAGIGIVQYKPIEA